jgi:hypothetical protein
MNYSFSSTYDPKQNIEFSLGKGLKSAKKMPPVTLYDNEMCGKVNSNPADD